MLILRPFVFASGSLCRFSLPKRDIYQSEISTGRSQNNVSSFAELYNHELCSKFNEAPPIL